MSGYIGVTSYEWFDYLSNVNYKDSINFWRKNTNRFKAIEQGSPFFFLVKNKKGIKTERQLLGMATFERFEVNTLDEAWDKYRDGNGDQTKESFISRMEIMFDTNAENKIGCIILSDFTVFKQPVLLSEIGIDFQNSIVSGKTIALYEVEKIKKAGLITRKEILKELDEIYQIGLSDDAESFPEGKQALKKHLIRERNPKLIKRAKEIYKLKYGKLSCQICGFDFEKEYGVIGSDYIEGHHTKPISQMHEGEETKIEDIAMVCANCHRMLHRKRPWLSLEELLKLMNKYEVE